jgi:peptide deformylase
MNKKRRKEIEDVRESLRKVYEELEELKDEEQEAFDNLGAFCYKNSPVGIDAITQLGFSKGTEYLYSGMRQG